MKIGFDFDGVWADTHVLKPIVAKKLFGVDIVGPFSRENVVGKYLTLEQYDETKHQVYYGNYPIEPIKDAPFYTTLLEQDEHELKVITSRSGSLLPVVHAMFAEHGLLIEAVGVGYKVSKIEACRGLDVFIDDDLDKLVPLIGMVPHLLLFSQPENRHEREPEAVTRVDSWYDVYQYIRYEI
ncbi:MAG: hypothetical protein QG589_606 [Patescibacteria group bacterium]|nr:hypothetical protein [Patescibacteria group bacterium]